jgi:hypothetical protein
MACSGITDIVVRETGRFMPGEIFRRTFGKSIWMTLLQRGVFPMGLSQTINTLTYERNAPTDAEPTWSTTSVVLDPWRYLKSETRRCDCIYVPIGGR